MPSAAPKDSPSGACFVRSRKGYFTFERSFEPPDRCSRLACVNGYFDSLEVFDADARRWRVAKIDTPHKTHGLAKFLAETVYNPVRAVRITWASPAAYRFEELREAYLAAVALDDDILTQFVSREELTARIRAAADFGDVVKVYGWASTDPD